MLPDLTPALRQGQVEPDLDPEATIPIVQAAEKIALHFALPHPGEVRFQAELNNAQIRLSIKENWMAIDPAIEWTSLNMARLNATVMDAEKAMKMLRETHPGMSRLEAWSEIRAEFLTAP